jgi:hypothetical protein
MVEATEKAVAQDDANRKNADSRYQLARIVIVGGFLTIFLLVGALLGLSRSGVESETTKVADKIFNVILPVLAGWVGTVLAFFFSAQSQERMSNTLDKQIERAATGGAAPSDRLVVQAMITFSAIRGAVDLDVVDPAKLTVREMVGRFSGKVPAAPAVGTPPAGGDAGTGGETGAGGGGGTAGGAGAGGDTGVGGGAGAGGGAAAGDAAQQGGGGQPAAPADPAGPAPQPLSRLVFVKGNVFRYVMHESVLNAYWRRVAEADKTADPGAKTLNDILSQPDLMAMVSRQLAFVPCSATLAQAKTAMERVAGAEDVVVTATGVPAEPMMGWLTDRDLLKAINGG